MRNFWTGIFLAAMASASEAAIITEQFTITLPSDISLYSSGHVFTITATYDDAGTILHNWNDGPDGEADFGGDDDTVAITVTLPASDYAFFSDAVISVAGLSLPVDATPRDVFSMNVSYAMAYLDPTTDGSFSVGLMADDVFLRLSDSGADNNNNLNYFELSHYYTDSDGVPQASVISNWLPASSVVRTTITQVPEPASLALIWLGLAGLAVSRRRKQ